MNRTDARDVLVGDQLLSRYTKMGIKCNVKAIEETNSLILLIPYLRCLRRPQRGILYLVNTRSIKNRTNSHPMPDFQKERLKNITSCRTSEQKYHIPRTYFLCWDSREYSNQNKLHNWQLQLRSRWRLCLHIFFLWQLNNLPLQK